MARLDLTPQVTIQCTRVADRAFSNGHITGRNRVIGVVRRKEQIISATNESWHEFIARVAADYSVTDGMPWLKYRELEETFGFPLHPEIRSLLESTNGIKDDLGCDLVWPIERMIEENRRTRCDHRLRKQYMPLDCLFFIADAGNGDMFGYAVVDNEIRCSDIFVWNHEDDSRTVVATRLRDFIEGWLSGTIRI